MFIGAKHHISGHQQHHLPSMGASKFYLANSFVMEEEVWSSSM
jgi:hypothetical protein